MECGLSSSSVCPAAAELLDHGLTDHVLMDRRFSPPVAAGGTLDTKEGKFASNNSSSFIKGRRVK